MSLQAELFVSPPLLTRSDLSDDEVVKDAVHELRRASGDERALASWALRWGDLLCARCDEAVDLDGDEGGRLAELSEELGDLEQEHDALRESARRCVDEIEDVLDEHELPSEADKAIQAELNKLSEAL